MTVWRQPEAPFVCIRPIPLGCALCNPAFGLRVRVISRHTYTIIDSQKRMSRDSLELTIDHCTKESNFKQRKERKEIKGTLFKCQIYRVLRVRELGTQQIVINTNQILSNVGFWGEGKTGVPWEKPDRAEKRTNKVNPHVTPSLGMEPGSHWWKARALFDLGH